MKKKFDAAFLFSYIVLAFVFTVMSFFIGMSVFQQGAFGYIIEIPTAVAFTIGAIYLFGSNQTGEDSEELPEHKDDEAEK